MFDIVENAIDAASLRNDLLDEAAGGLVIFEGLVRDHNEGRPVSALEYEIFEPMARREAEKILTEARQRFEVIHLRGAHRYGHLSVGEMAVWVGASARHRAAAFEACRFLIDEIKLRLPVWKKEHYVDGPSEWVDCEGCHHHHGPDFLEEHYYSRQVRLPELGSVGQRKLGDAKVLVVGAGGLGCPALGSLAGAGVGRITICDGDRLDVTNLHRQNLYSHQDLGEYKATLAARRLADLNPFIRIDAHLEHVDPDNAATLVADHDVILDCTDNFPARFLLHDMCFLLGRVLVQGSIHQYEGQVQVFDFRGIQNAGCLRCAWPVMPDAGCVESCTEAGVLGPVPGVLGNLQAMETLKVIYGSPSPAGATTVLVDLGDLTTSRIKRTRDPDCPLCGPTPRITKVVPEEYDDRRDWEVGLEEFRNLHPQGSIIDIREDHERLALNGEMAAWPHLPFSDKDRWSEWSAEGHTILVCEHGIRSRVLADALRASGKDRVWSLWQGVEGLQKST